MATRDDTTARRTFGLIRLFVAITVFAIALAAATNIENLHPAASVLLFLLGIISTPLVLLTHRHDLPALLRLLALVAFVPLLGAACFLICFLLSLTGAMLPWIILMGSLFFWLLLVLNCWRR